MAAAESTVPPAPEARSGGRKRVLAVVIAVVIIAAALGIGVVIILSRPSAPSLDHVTVTVQGGATTLDQTATVSMRASALDTRGIDETANATLTWGAAPSGLVQITHPGAISSAVVAAVQPGSVTITATATWNGVTKSGSATLMVTALHFYLTSNQGHPAIGVPFLMTVRVARPDNSTDSTFNALVHFTSSDPTATMPPDTLISPGDAGVKTFANVTINQPGAVTLTATNGTYSITGSTTVFGNRPPVAAFLVTPIPSNPARVTLDASGSSDPDAGETLTYLWSFGDGNVSQVSTAITTYMYGNTGTFTITLTVQDNYGASSLASHTYTVHTPPHASFNVANEVQNATATGVRVEFDATSSTGGDGRLLTYAWTFGDGSQATVSTAITFHNYSLPYNGQTVTVTLVVANNYSLSNATSQPVPVSTTALPPVASFTVSIDSYTRTVSADGSGSHPQTGQPIIYYNWTWGDGTPNLNSTSKTATHTYATDGMYTITLSVVDTLNAKGTVSHSAPIKYVDVAPVAIFEYRRTQLTVTVNASKSFDLNGNLAWFAWTWGDGSSAQIVPASQITTPHAYAAAGLYQITLVANDTTNLHSAPATRYVSVALSTLDYTFSDFFNVPFGEWWDMRTGVYGDKAIRAYCFNATSINDLLCTPGTNPNIPTSETSPPYTDWYPQPTGFLGWDKKGNDPLIYTPYRFDVIGVNQPGYNVSEPVFLPVLNYGVTPAPSSYINFDWRVQYLDVRTANYENTVLGCPLFGGFHSSDDGFMIRGLVSLTMDHTEAARIFGAPASGSRTTLQAWWTTESQPCNAGRNFPSPLENSVQSWFSTEGNNKYDVFSSFQFAYTPFYTNISGTVDPDLTTHVTIDTSAWGLEVLLARWFYWGNASYQANYLNSAAARGWWGMELAWFEGLRFMGGLTTAGMDFHLNTVMQYHLNQLSTPGPDGQYRGQPGEANPPDDVPYWTWGPWLTDYITPPLTQHVSELDRYTAGHSPVTGYPHGTPGTGTWIYGTNASYEFVPIAWAPKAGEQWHFVFPAGNEVFYNPDTSPQPSNPASADYQVVLKPLQYWTTFPNTAWGGDVWSWNQTTWTWDAFGSTSPPSWPCSCAANTYPIVPYGAIIFYPQGWLNPGSPPRTPGGAGPGASFGDPSNTQLSAAVLASYSLFWNGAAVAVPISQGRIE